MSREVCPVCRSDHTSSLMEVDGKTYRRCDSCQTRYLVPAHWLAPSDEFAHYQLHENFVDDPGYRKFLSRLADPLLETLRPDSNGLDFGCGPGPALAAMLREAGHTMALFDPYFHNDRSVLAGSYDFITCTETAEHFHDPAGEFDRLDTMLKPGGWLGVMTCFQTDDAKFADWHYRKDPTHVVFYRAATFEVLAQQHGWTVHSPVKDVVLMCKAQVTAI